MTYRCYILYAHWVLSVICLGCAHLKVFPWHLVEKMVSLSWVRLRGHLWKLCWNCTTWVTIYRDPYSGLLCFWVGTPVRTICVFLLSLYIPVCLTESWCLSLISHFSARTVAGSGCWVTSRHTWASAPWPSRAFFLVHWIVLNTTLSTICPCV